MVVPRCGHLAARSRPQWVAPATGAWERRRASEPRSLLACGAHLGTTACTGPSATSAPGPDQASEPTIQAAGRESGQAFAPATRARRACRQRFPQYSTSRRTQTLGQRPLAPGAALETRPLVDARHVGGGQQRPLERGARARLSSTTASAPNPGRATSASSSRIEASHACPSAFDHAHFGCRAESPGPVREPLAQLTVGAVEIVASPGRQPDTSRRPSGPRPARRAQSRPDLASEQPPAVELRNLTDSSSPADAEQQLATETREASRDMSRTHRRVLGRLNDRHGPGFRDHLARRRRVIGRRKGSEWSIHVYSPARPSRLLGHGVAATRPDAL